MSQELARAEAEKEHNGSLLLGTGLAVASMILVPALAMRLGLGASLTGALRIALMKASNRAANGKRPTAAASSPRADYR
ncbi:MAG: hypothetical protein ACU83N_14630 [Gammaproteobacteria bacterium]